MLVKFYGCICEHYLAVEKKIKVCNGFMWFTINVSKYVFFHLSGI